MKRYVVLNQSSTNITVARRLIRWLAALALGATGLGIRTAAAQAVTPVPGIAVILMVDNSESNSDTDKGNFRWVAVQMIADMLTPSDYLGLIPFTKSVAKDAELGYFDLAPVSAPRRDGVVKFAEKVVGKGSTDLVVPIETAGKMLSALQADKIPIYAIYLSDGQQYEKRKDLDGDLAQAARVFQKAAIPIHTIALSSDADLKRMEEIALLTGGSTRVIQNSRDLLMAFHELIWSELPIWTAIDTTRLDQGNGTADFLVDLSAKVMIFFTFSKNATGRGNGAPARLDLARKAEGAQTFTAIEQARIKRATTSSYWLDRLEKPESGDYRITVKGNEDFTIVMGLWLDHDPFQVVSPGRGATCWSDRPIPIRVSTDLTRPENYEIAASLVLNDPETKKPVPLAGDGQYRLVWNAAEKSYGADIFTAPQAKDQNLLGIYAIKITCLNRKTGFHRTLPQFNIKVEEARRVSLAPAELDFGSIPGAGVQTRELTLQWNRTAGDARLALIPEGAQAGGLNAGPEFQLSSLGAGQGKRQVELTVKPELAAGNYTAALRVQSADSSLNASPDKILVKYSRPAVNVKLLDGEDKEIEPGKDLKFSSTQLKQSLRIAVEGTDKPVRLKGTLEFFEWAETQPLPEGVTFNLAGTSFKMKPSAPNGQKDAFELTLPAGPAEIAIQGVEGIGSGEFSGRVTLTPVEGNVKLEVNTFILYLTTVR